MDLLELLLAYLATLRAPALEPYLSLWPRHAAAGEAAADEAVADEAVAGQAVAGEAAVGATALGTGAVRNVAAAFPVVALLPAMTAAVPPAAMPLAQSLRCHATTLTWRQTYRRGELAARFFDNYAYAQVLPENAAAAPGKIACGVLLLGPHTLYPSHRHIPEEIYVPLSGTARWQQGDAVWRARAPGSVIRHASDEPHAMQTGEQALLAIYLWRGGDLSQPARLVGEP